jgi:hypothetical protein
MVRYEVKQKTTLRWSFVINVAGLGVEPSLRDYAICFLQFPGVSDYLLPSEARS